MVFIRRVKVGKHTYLAEVKSVRENDKVRQKFIRYVGREVDGEKILSGSINNTSVTDVKIYGPLLVLNAIAKELNLHELLGNYSSEILSMVYAHCTDPKSLNKMEDWFSRTELNHILNLEKLTERRLVDSFENINSDERIEYFEQKIFRSLKNKYPIDTDCFFYDLTNVYFFGINCKIAKRAKSKEGGFKRCIQIGLAVTKEGLPIFHKTFPGNVFDSRSLFELIRLLREHGIEKGFLVWDRGVTSKINISDAKKLGFEVICGVPMTGKIPEEIDKMLHGENIAIPKNRIQLHNCSYYVLRKKYRMDTTSGYIYICLNLKKKIEDQEKRLKQIHEAQEIIKKGKKIKSSIKKYLTKKGRLIKNVLYEAEKHDGISILFSTKKLSNEEVTRRYFEKDIVEKAFACLKGVVKVRPIRKWIKERVKAHIFICFIAYLLIAILNYKLKKKNKSFNAVEAMEQLETLYRIHMLNTKTRNKFTKTVAFTKNQEEILKAVDKRLLKCSD